VTRRGMRLAIGMVVAMVALLGLGAASAAATIDRAPTKVTACDLITPAEIESVLSWTLLDTGTADNGGAGCEYRPDTGDNFEHVRVEFSRDPGSAAFARTVFDSDRADIARRQGSFAYFNDVGGVGDAAFQHGFYPDTSDGSDSTLVFLSGPFEVKVTVQHRTKASADLEADTIALAKLALSRLPAGSDAATPGAGGSSSPAQSPAESAVPERSSLPGSFPDPTQVDTSPKALGVSALLTGLLMLMVAFPSELFDRTLKTHYRTVRGWFGPLAQLDQRINTKIRTRPQWVRFAGFMVIGGVLAAFVDPTLGWNLGSVALVLGLIVSRAVVTVAFALPEAIFMRNKYRLGGRFEALPAALAVAALCVLVSRLAHFEPGYLYGIIVGIEFSRKLARDEHGRLAAWAAGWVLVVSIAAWFAWIPVVNAISGGDTSFPILFIDAAVGMIFPIGIATLVIGLLPMRVLDGKALYDWSRRGWLALWLTGGFLFVWVLIHPESNFVGTTQQGGDVTRAMVPFFVFGVISLGLWAYLRNRPPSPLEFESVAGARAAAEPRNQESSRSKASHRAAPAETATGVAVKGSHASSSSTDGVVAFCHECGTKASPSERFCAACGAAFTIGKSAT